MLGFAALVLPPLYRWTIGDATISGTTRAACDGAGACWTLIRTRLPTFFTGITRLTNAGG